MLVADNSWYSAEGLSSLGVKFKIEEKIKGKSVAYSATTSKRLRDILIL